MTKCIQKFKKYIGNHQTWILILIFGVFSLISALVLIILVGVKTIEWNWLTGYLLGTIAALGSLLIANLATIRLIRDENYFSYYFFYILRIGIYATPFLLSFFMSINIFAWQGILVGFLPIAVSPFFRNWLINQKQENSETK